MSFKNKKNAMVYSEVFLIAISIFVIFFLIFILGLNVKNVDKDIEEIHNDLSYNFPVVFIKSFLNVKLEEDNEEFQGLYVKDLFYLNSKESRDLIEIYKKKYLGGVIVDFDNFNSLDLFKEFSGSNFREVDLLAISYDLNASNLPCFSGVLVDDNFFFYFKTKNNTYSIIYFKKFNEDLIKKMCVDSKLKTGENYLEDDYRLNP